MLGCPEFYLWMNHDAPYHAQCPLHTPPCIPDHAQCPLHTPPCIPDHAQCPLHTPLLHTPPCIPDHAPSYIHSPQPNLWMTKIDIPCCAFSTLKSASYNKNKNHVGWASLHAYAPPQDGMLRFHISLISYLPHKPSLTWNSLTMTDSMSSPT
jgi:hypothetical protein